MKKLLALLLTFAMLLSVAAVFAGCDTELKIKKPSSNEEDDDEEEDDSETIPCESIELSVLSFVITEADQVLNLSVTCSPLNTTDKVTFSSSDKAVIAVDERGNITYVGNGKADVTVKCGSIEASCEITCEVPAVNEPTEPEPTEELVEIRFLTTLIQTSDYFQCEPGTQYTLCIVDEAVANEVRWSSDDPDVAEFRNGVVYMIGEGTTTVRAKYGDQELSCTVIVGDNEGDNLLPSDTDVDLSQYSGWCHTAYGGWKINGGELLTDEFRNSPYMDISFSSGDYGVSYQFGILPVETSDAIILKWSPLEDDEAGCYDEASNSFIPDEDASGTTVAYQAQFGDETIYLYVTVY